MTSKTLVIAATVLTVAAAAGGLVQMLRTSQSETDAALAALRDANTAEGVLVRDLDRQVERLDELTLRLEGVLGGLSPREAQP